MNKLIAVVGMAGSGKSIATDYLKEHGWNKIYFGGAVYDRMRKEGIEITPESQKEFRENIRKQYGMAAVAVLLEEEITELQRHYDKLEGLFNIDLQASDILLSAMASTPLPEFADISFSSSSFADSI